MPHDPNTPPPPSNNYLCNFKQLWCFSSIAVIIKLLCELMCVHRAVASMRQTEALVSVILSALSQCCFTV